MTAPAAKQASVGHRTLIGASWMIGFRMASRLLGLVSTLVLARLLLPTDFGLVAIASTIAAATDSVTELGVQDSLVRRKDDAHELFNTAFTMQLARGLLSALVLAAAAPIASRWFNDPRLGPVLMVMAVFYALGGFENIGVVEFRRNIRYDYEFWLAIVPRFLGFLVTLTMAIALRSYWALVIGIAVGKLARVAATYMLHPYRPRCSLHGWRELAGFSFWMWMSALAYIVWLRSDAAIIGPALGTAQLGIVLVAYDVALLPSTEILAPVATVLFAGVVAARHQGADTMAKVFRIAVGLLMLLAPMALVISATSGFIVATLLGSQWVEAQKLVAIFACSGLFGPISYICSIHLTAHGKVKMNFLIVAGASAVKVLLMSLAATTRDPATIAEASLVVTAIEACIFVLVLRREGGSLRPVLASAVRLVVAGLAAAIAMLATGAAWQTTSLPPVPAFLHGAPLGCLGLLIYAVTLYALWRAAHRPDGPEIDILGMMDKILPKRLRMKA